jgi:hypothetical protein
MLLFAGCSFENTVDDPSMMGDDAPVDTDGDTFLDSQDNCPSIANPDQRDHDADARGDKCDLCPHIAAATDPDGDGDGIGDACDPRVGLDVVVAFDGFYDPGAPSADWRSFGGTWSISNGALRQTDVRGGQLVWQSSIARAYVDFGYKATTVGPAYTITTSQGPYTVQPSVSSIAGAQQQSRSYGCSVSKDPGNRVAAWSNYNSNWNSSPQSWTGDLAPNGSYRIIQNLATSNRCNFTAGTVNASDTEAIGAVDGTFSLAIGAASIEIDYIFVVAIGS